MTKAAGLPQGRRIDRTGRPRHALSAGPWGWLLLTSLSLSAAGCVPLPQWKNPFAAPLPEYKTQYGLTPAQKVERLRQMAQELKGESAAAVEPTARALVAELKEEKDPLLRREMVRTLGQLATDASLPGLRAASDDSAQAVRLAACRAWARRGDRQAEAALAGLLAHDKDIDVRLAAADGLARCGSVSSVQHLAGALDDRDPALQVAAMAALEKSTGRELGQDVAAWRDYVAQLGPTGALDQGAAAAVAAPWMPAEGARR